MGTVRPSLTSKALIQMSKQEESISMSPNFEMEGGFLNQARGCLSRTGIRQGKRYQKYSRCCKTDFISRGIDFLFNFFFNLKYGLLTMSCSYFLYNKVIQLFIYSFFIFFSTSVYHRISNTVLCSIQHDLVV